MVGAIMLVGAEQQDSALQTHNMFYIQMIHLSPVCAKKTPSLVFIVVGDAPPPPNLNVASALRSNNVSNNN